ncbi:hypothetical protein ACJQWK_03450 [Exserohilum turcicum]
MLGMAPRPRTWPSLPRTSAPCPRTPTAHTRTHTHTHVFGWTPATPCCSYIPRTCMRPWLSALPAPAPAPACRAPRASVVNPSRFQAKVMTDVTIYTKGAINTIIVHWAVARRALRGVLATPAH